MKSSLNDLEDRVTLQIEEVDYMKLGENVPRRYYYDLVNLYQITQELLFQLNGFSKTQVYNQFHGYTCGNCEGHKLLHPIEEYGTIYLICSNCDWKQKVYEAKVIGV